MDANAGRGSATRLHILSAAGGLFAEHGYEAVSIESVLKASGISRGALYHHFASKDTLFTAVLEGIEARIVEAAASGSQGAANPLDALRTGCGAWLELVASDAAVRRIAVIDAPSVLGWQAWREMEGRYALGLLRGALGAAASLGRLEPARVETYAYLLLAVLNEMAMLVARSDDRGAAVEAAREAVEQVVSRLVGVEAGADWPAVA